MFSGLPCKAHIAHIAHIARNPGRVDVRRVGAPSPHFAWFVHGFCMWNSLFFATCGTACFFAWFWHDMILHGMILHGFCTFFRTVLHVARFFA